MKSRLLGAMRGLRRWYGVPRFTREREWPGRNPKPNTGGPACILTLKRLYRGGTRRRRPWLARSGVQAVARPSCRLAFAFSRGRNCSAQLPCVDLNVVLSLECVKKVYSRQPHFLEKSASVMS
jgi:hypothetical protein